jgi:Bacteriophage Sf6, terminase small subunit-like
VEPLSPTVQKLRALPKPQYNPVWPEGIRQPLTKELAERFFNLLSTWDTSLLQLLRQHPELPPYAQLNSWRCNNKAGFGDQWRVASHNRAQFLAERCAELAKTVTPKTAHVVRVQFDIYRWFAAKLHPEAYGEKLLPQQQSTTVNVGIAISPERLAELRAKLAETRNALQPKERPANDRLTS